MSVALQESQEARRFLNPAFVSTVLASSANGYQEVSGERLPFSLAYLVTPLILHAETRRALPTTLATKLASWAAKNDQIVSRLQRRAGLLTAYTGQALLVGTNGGILSFDADVTIGANYTEKQLIKYANAASPEVTDILKRALFVGRWFGASGGQVPVATALGVRFAPPSA